MAFVDVYSAYWQCPEEGCFFVFRFENALSEDEGREILNGISKLHLRQRHPGLDAEVSINVIEPEAPGRPKLVN